MSATSLPSPAVRQAVNVVLARMMDLVTAVGDVVGEAVRPAPSASRLDALMATTTTRVQDLGGAMGLLVGVVKAPPSKALAREPAAPAPTEEARP